MKKFRLKKSTAINVLILIFSILWVGAVIVNIFKWLGIFTFYSVSLPLEISLSILGLFVVFILIKFYFLSYTVDARGVRLVLFWDMLGNCVKPDKIWKAVVANEALYLCFTNKKNEPQIACILINPNEYDDFIKSIKKFNPNILSQDAEIDISV